MVKSFFIETTISTQIWPKKTRQKIDFLLARINRYGALCPSDRAPGGWFLVDDFT